MRLLNFSGIPRMRNCHSSDEFRKLSFYDALPDKAYHIIILSLRVVEGRYLGYFLAYSKSYSRYLKKDPPLNAKKDRNTKKQQQQTNKETKGERNDNFILKSKHQ